MVFRNSVFEIMTFRIMTGTAWRLTELAMAPG